MTAEIGTTGDATVGINPIYQQSGLPFKAWPGWQHA
jgi:hypothetical protein